MGPISRQKYEHPRYMSHPSEHEGDVKRYYLRNTKRPLGILSGKDRYRLLRAVGNGTFGTVFRALDLETDEMVAVKKTFVDKRYKNRELDIMQKLVHPNVVRLISFFYTPVKNKPGEQWLNIVMGFMPDTLYSLTQRVGRAKQRLSWTEVKIYAFQLLRSIWHIHSLGICHRDIKPQNVLVDAPRYVLKLADFGSAKELEEGESHLAYICSRFYRAPELLLGNTKYATSVDIWSAACVIAETFMHHPLFMGDSNTGQLMAVVKTLGTPTRQELRCLSPNFNGYLPTVRALPWASVFRGKASTEAIALLRRLLEYDPAQRIRPMHGLAHEFFDALRHYDELPGNTDHMEKVLFDWTEQEIQEAGVKLHEIFPPKVLNQLNLPF
eukprot:jgi/Bigna1/90917/estExt_fgenesh1_pg.C_830004